jgi:hypothetical protein
MQQLFEIKLKPMQIDAEKYLHELFELGWYMEGGSFRNMDEEYHVVFVLDLKISFSLKCLIVDLLPLDEGEWNEKEYPYREEVVRFALKILKKMPFELEVKSIERKTAPADEFLR